ncbi:glycosyltransferase family 39 protein [Couchioplanes caeruleus]|uniref:Glycosyltransferase RgtA/B/C/D-like domain-containing protein n=2 Tax=Couchioplanes caeruleus TaxID=56438 RepID=A0A1K0GRN1_9ACTN|nr:glycosyltransferase family 39 protein [Couchioplanes caeruleus]OJF15078.1 hypothetical protein BG844_06390 [Couchioplanes caeruleus subsp. caeruleus]ROP33946.1 mannosyltransferase [Couchioplanes caeruleus]
MTQTVEPPQQVAPARERTPHTSPGERRWATLFRRWAPGLIPALAMLVVGRFRLLQPSLGWDENATWLVGTRTVGQIVDLAQNLDAVISPYYLFMHFWMGVFGDSELSLRMPSLLAVAAGVGVSAELGRRLFGPGAGLLAGLMMVLVPQFSRYAQEARAYGLAFFFAALASLLLYRAFEKPSWGRWSAYGFAIALTGVSHLLALLVLGGHLYAVAARWWPTRDKRLLRWVAVTAVGLMPVSPLLYMGSQQRGRQLEWIPELDTAGVLAAPGQLFGSAAAGLLLIGIAATVRAERQLVRDLVVLATLPPLVLIGISLVSSSMWVPRYVLFVLPAIVLLAAAALHGLRLRMALALVLLAAVSAPAHAQVRGPVSHMGSDFRAVKRILQQNQQPGDVIVFSMKSAWSLRAGVSYQLRGQLRPLDVEQAEQAAEVGELNAKLCADQVACLGNAKRVWYLRQGASGKPLADSGPLEATLTRDYRQVKVWQPVKTTLVLLERNRDPGPAGRVRRSG